MDSLISKWQTTVNQHNQKLTKIRESSREVIKSQQYDDSSSDLDEPVLKDPNLQDLMPQIASIIP